MKITRNWLRQYVEFDYTPEELVERLTMLGLEVDTHGREALNFDRVVVGRVTDKRPHPDADRLSVCAVDIGDETLGIVCGAPNVEAGQTVPVATVGAVLPGGLKIKRAKIRGVESAGMICSEKELGLSAAADGIMILESELAPGTPFESVVGEPDYLIDIEVTPNRPDCFGILGIARDVSALAGGKFTKPAVEVAEGDEPVAGAIRVEIHDRQKCPRYTARYVSNVTVKPSPLWLARRLEQIGIRSINNIVDVTNFVMMETGQPLHAFDYDNLQGGLIHVRCARQGEKFTTLDDKSHSLTPENLLICDGNRAVALAGIMGGQNSEVSDETRNVLLESAYFDPVNIRRSAKTLGISTESSKRFERGVDPNGVDYALDRAAQLLAELSDGTIAKGIADVYPAKIKPLTLSLRPGRVNSLLGVEIPVARMTDILENLGFSVKVGDPLQIEVPTFRPDVKREADLIEEIGRVFGYDNIPAELTASVRQSRHRSSSQEFEATARAVLTGFGFSEVVTYNLVSSAAARLFLPGEQQVRLLNPLSEDLSTLRPHLLASLLRSVRWNLNRSSRNLKFFELGTVFSTVRGETVERRRLGGVLTGAMGEDSWREKTREIDFYDLKGFVQHFFQRSHLSGLEFDSAGSSLATGLQLSVTLDGKTVGLLGEAQREILDAFDISQPVFFFDFDLTELAGCVLQQTRFAPVPKFPAVARDIALVVDEALPAQQILQQVQSSAGPLLTDVRIFDVFRSEQIGDGKKSLALSLTFRSRERTLKEKEVDKQMSKVLSSLSDRFSARLRA